MTRPVIGITCNYDASKEAPLRKDNCKQPVFYYLALQAAGALPMLIPAISDPVMLREYLEHLDGVLFSGANDLPPECYGAELHPKTKTMSRQRYEFEWALANIALKECEHPLLGICGGIQILSTVMGGTLFQHIPDEIETDLIHSTPKGGDASMHEVSVNSGGRLEKLLGSRAQVNSFHHQSLDKVGEGFKVTARADDGVIEAMELDSDRFVVGVQWHPERIQEIPGSLEIFRAFVEACSEFQSS
jgi:putative glutamine amidotransferase